MIHSADPKQWSLFSHLSSIYTSISAVQNILKQNKFQVKIIIAIGGTVVLAEGIIDDNCLVFFTSVFTVRIFLFYLDGLKEALRTGPYGRCVYSSGKQSSFVLSGSLLFAIFKYSLGWSYRNATTFYYDIEQIFDFSDIQNTKVVALLQLHYK